MRSRHCYDALSSSRCMRPWAKCIPLPLQVAGCVLGITAVLLLVLQLGPYEHAPDGIKKHFGLGYGQEQQGVARQRHITRLEDRIAMLTRRLAEAQATVETTKEESSGFAKTLDAVRSELVNTTRMLNSSVMAGEADSYVLEHSIRTSSDEGLSMLKGLNVSQHLMIPMIFSRHTDRICCVLGNLADMLFANTVADIWLFSHDDQARSYVQGNCPHVLEHNVYYMPLRNWGKIPTAAGPRESWSVSDQFNEEYRLMGVWRIGFQMPFAKSLGYQYVLQIDSDSEFLAPIQFDLVKHMASKDLYMSAQQIVADPVEVTWGLPELTRWFIISERLEPKGVLFEHCSPPSLQGLFTTNHMPLRSNYTKIEGDNHSLPYGWSNTVPYTNCIMWNTEFWVRPLVQKYLRLVLYTAGIVRFRWQEQAVMSMVWQTFVPRENFALLGLDYKHPGKCKV